VRALPFQWATYQEETMTIRALISGICLIAIGSSAVLAQPAAQAPNAPATNAPAVDGAPKTPDTPAPVPEVVVPPGQHGDVIIPKTDSDPAAVVTPPRVDPRMDVQHGALSGGNPK
jgi:hypothetical protein